MSKRINMEHGVAAVKILKSNTVRKSRSCNYNTHLHSLIEGERKRIARELHDILGHELLDVNTDLLSLKERIPKKYSLIHQQIEKLAMRINGSIDVMQKLITELRPGLLDKFGLEEAIGWYIEEVKRRANIDCDFLYDVKSVKLDKEQETAIFRILQEALSNVIRHAKADKIVVKICEDSSNLVLTIKDNGGGITKRQINNAKSFGIIGMRERTSCLGGFLEIRGSKKSGTTVQLNIPISVNKTKRKKTNTANY